MTGTLKQLIGGALAATLALAISPPAATAARPAASNRTAALIDSRFVPVAPARLLDGRPGTTTADGLFAGTGIVPAGGTVDVMVAPRLGIPDTATAVVLNVTAIDAVAPGFVTAYPFGSVRPNASNLNIERVGQTVANLVVSPLSSHPSSVTFYMSGGGYLAADVLGYFVPTAGKPSTDGRYIPLTPSRLVDSRFHYPLPNPGDTKNCTDFATWDAANFYFWRYKNLGYGDVARLDSNNDGIPCEGLGPPSQPIVPPDLYKFASGETRSLAILGSGGLPSSGVAAVALNVTAAGVAARGFVTVFPGASPLPNSSNLNVETGDVRPNMVIVPVGPGGTIQMYTTAPTHLIVDVAGYFTDGTASESTSGLFRPIAPARLLDTRPGTSTVDGVMAGTGRLGAGSTTSLPVGGRAGVPADGIAAVVNVTGISAVAPGFVSVFPGGAAVPNTSTVNLAAAGQTVANAAFATLGVSGALGVFSSGPTDLAVDVSGVFLT
jgi:hypothetical protein